MLPRLRLSIRASLAIIATCCVGAWLAREWASPKRILGPRFALIGPMDIDGDGLDDRVRLSARIARNGGVVDYDLPGTGRASGRIGPSTSWYIVGRPSQGTSVPGPFRKAEALAVSQARSYGVRPMPIEKLLTLLGGE